jgi:hypothetical protein
VERNVSIISGRQDRWLRWLGPSYQPQLGRYSFTAMIVALTAAAAWFPLPILPV